ncbi:MAG: hypothetical protein WA803_20705 [Steroidobacteraceae bacterium]
MMRRAAGGVDGLTRRLLQRKVFMRMSLRNVLIDINKIKIKQLVNGDYLAGIGV